MSSIPSRLIARCLLAPTLALLASGPVAAAGYYSVHVTAGPTSGAKPHDNFTAIDLNDQGVSLVLRSHGSKRPSSYHTYDEYGSELRKVGQFTRSESVLVLRGINNWGDVVGDRAEYPLGLAKVWKDQGFAARIDGFAHDPGQAWGVALSDNGHVAGVATVQGGFTTHAFVWQAGVMQEIGTFGGLRSSASAVNNHGVVVGYAELASSAPHAFSFENGQLRDLGTLLGGSTSEANDINDHGQIAGWSSLAGAGTRAVIFEGTQIHVLPTGDDTYSADALRINNLGQVIGTYTTQDYEEHLFLYDGSTVHRLQDLLSPADRMTWKITVAAAINNSGWVLVGARKRDVPDSSAVLLLKPPA